MVVIAGSIDPNWASGNGWKDEEWHEGHTRVNGSLGGWMYLHQEDPVRPKHSPVAELYKNVLNPPSSLLCPPSFPFSDILNTLFSHRFTHSLIHSNTPGIKHREKEITAGEDTNRVSAMISSCSSLGREREREWGRKWERVRRRESGNKLGWEAWWKAEGRQGYKEGGMNKQDCFPLVRFSMPFPYALSDSNISLHWEWLFPFVSR